MCRVVKVNQVFRIDSYVKGRLRLSRLKERLGEIRQMEAWGQQPVQTVYGCFVGKEESSAEYERLISEEKVALSSLERTVQQRFTGICFVTYLNDEDAKSAKRKLGKPKPMKSWLGLLFACFPCLLRAKSKLFQGRVLSIKRAPDPSDIIWENLGIPWYRVMGRRLTTALATAAALCVGGGVVYLSSYIKGQVYDAYQDIEDPSLGQTLGFNILSFLPSMIVAFMNVVLTAVIWYCERQSLYTTITDMQATVTRNLTLAMFINTALVAIPIHLNDWYGPHGLVVEIYNIMISNAILPPLLQLFSPKASWRWVRLRKAMRQEGKCMLTQQEAHTLSEDLPINMPNLCAGLMKTYLLSLMYAPVLPLGLVLGVGAVLLQYWVAKYMLLRRHSRPVRLSDELDEVMLQFIALGCAAYAASTGYFFYDLQTDLFLPGAIGCGLVLVYFFTPLQRMLKLCLRKQLIVNVATLSETTKTYEESAVDFITDYDRANPATTEEGHKWWVEQITKKQGPEAGQIAASRLLSIGMKNYVKGKVKVKTAKPLQSEVVESRLTEPSQIVTETKKEKETDISADATHVSATLVPKLNLEPSHLKYRSELYFKGRNPPRSKSPQAKKL